MQEASVILGIDVGGTGTKGGLVDIEKGVLITERFRLDTPKPATPKAVAETFAAIADHFKWKGPIGCGFPAAIKKNTVMTAANIDRSWIGVNASELFSKASGSPVWMLNDADAAGLAEMGYGAGKGEEGVVMVITIGTGLGSAVFMDGRLVPNTELGHLNWKGQSIEIYASGAARKREGLTWEEWAGRFNAYLKRLVRLFWPDLFIFGGGVCKNFSNFEGYLDPGVPFRAAHYLNHAGTVGAALYAAHQIKSPKVV